eukprot:CAMPEP_0170415726 /NCGR_PEP_ID=MMETSP0117_2-20130122/32762_1 /TAXON_ID=400756 /ORGANISM="Durinskia baltica, Strain CSIRO CS-38" /LENGTH=124 /DNA_ID=CAMNT_0010673715 /DNA_START=52 /DNA_END=423 /DNA_ORIENTATION=-
MAAAAASKGFYIEAAMPLLPRARSFARNGVQALRCEDRLRSCHSRSRRDMSRSTLDAGATVPRSPPASGAMCALDAVAGMRPRTPRRVQRCARLRRSSAVFSGAVVSRGRCPRAAHRSSPLRPL